MLIEFTLYLILSIIGCTIYYKWAQKNQIVDTPNERSSHTHQPVRGMGIIFPIIFSIFSVITWLNAKPVTSPLIDLQNIGPMFIGSGVLIAGITGFIDDRIDLRSYVRLPLYTLSVVVSLFPMIAVNINIWWFVVLTVVIVGVINTYNFMDGINGITGFYSSVLLLSAITLLLLNDQQFLLSYQLETSALITLAYLISFGIFNYRNKALAFLGDSGSVSIGLFVCILLVWNGYRFQRWDVLVLLLVYGVDSVGTIIIRLIRKENIFKAHRSHFYQDLVHVKGIQHLQVAFLYAFLQAIINALYVYYFEAINQVFVITLVLLSIVFVVGKKQMGTLQLRTNNE